MTRNIVAIFLVSMVFLQGCAPAIVGGAATGAAVAHDRRTVGSVVDDQGIELKAFNTLFRQNELYDVSHINVTSYNGIVLVTGETPTKAMKAQITEEIENLPKVRKVHNEMAIASPSAMSARSSDTWLTSKVKTKMTADTDIDPFRFKVVTSRGTVYLMGMVTRAQADKAVDLTRRTGGVQRVVKIFEYTD